MNNVEEYHEDSKQYKADIEKYGEDNTNSQIVDVTHQLYETEGITIIMMMRQKKSLMK